MFDLNILLLIGGAVGAIAVAGLALLSSLTPWVKRTRADFLKAEYAYTPHSDHQTAFHRMLTTKNERPFATDSQLYLSIVFPAMNEELRLQKTLDETLGYLSLRKHRQPEFTYEVIIVDDGSRDKTADVAAQYARRHEGLVHVLRLDANRGKGGAVRAGVLHSRGRLILFADADGATTFEDIEKLESRMAIVCGGEVDETFPAIVVGSRAHLEQDSMATRSFFRTILMVGFHSLVWVFAVRTIKDTQCGFKLFTRGAAARLFPILHVERWAFDVELLYLAELWKLKVEEVAVNWHEVEGSKIVPFWSWLEMGRDLVLIWFRYQVGIWKPEVPDV